MGAGGVIQQYAALLLPVVLYPVVYATLSAADRDKAEVIKVKPFLDRTEEDVNFLLSKIPRRYK